MKYKSGYKYILAENFSVQTKITHNADIVLDGRVTLRTNGLLSIRKGYAWDGASGPVIDTKTIMRGSLIHDALYQLMREGHLGQQWFYAVNNELHAACIEDGMHWLRAWYVLRGVNLFGEQYATPTLASNIHEAP